LAKSFIKSVAAAAVMGVAMASSAFAADPASSPARSWSAIRCRSASLRLRLSSVFSVTLWLMNGLSFRHTGQSCWISLRA
jgi:hypothetical protein